MENHEDIKAIAEKLHKVKMEMGDLFEKFDLTIGEVLSLLSSTIVQTACESGMHQLKLIEVLSKGMQAYDALDDDEEEKETLQWLN